MAPKSIRSASVDGQFTRVTIEPLQGIFKKIEVVKDGQTAALYTVPIAAALPPEQTASLFAIRFRELHPDLPPEQQQAWPEVEYRLHGASSPPPQVVEASGQLKITYPAVTPRNIQGSATFGNIRVTLIFRAGTAEADKGWIDIDLDFDYPAQVKNQTAPGKVWELHVECPRVPFKRAPDCFFLDPDGRVGLLREVAASTPPLRHIASLQFLGVYETGKADSGVRYAQGVVFAGTDENGHRKDVFVEPPPGQTTQTASAAEVGFDLVNPIHLSGGNFVRAPKYVLSLGDTLGFGGAEMTFRLRAFSKDGHYNNAAVDWTDVADLYRDWVRTSTLFRRALARDPTAPVDNMSPWTIVENYGIDSASDPSGDSVLARALEKHPILVPGRADSLGKPDVPGNTNESLPELLVRLRKLFEPQAQVRFEAQIWGFEMGGFYRFLGGLPPLCDVAGTPGKHAAAMAWLQAGNRRIVPLATTDPLNANFDRKRFGGHVRRQGSTVVDAIAQPFPAAVIQELTGRVDTAGRKFLLNRPAYPQANQMWNHGRRTDRGDEPFTENALSAFYGIQQRLLCPSAPVIGIYLDEWLLDVRSGKKNGLFDHGFRLIEFMKAFQARHFCYDRTHQHASGTGYDNVIGWGSWHVQRVAQILRGAAKRGHALNPSFALTYEHLCPEALVPFFEDYYDHLSSAARVLAGDSRSLELRQSTADPNDDLLARTVPVFQYVYSQQITSKMNILEDDPVTHAGYLEGYASAPGQPDAMLDPILDTTEIPGFPAWRQMAKGYCELHYTKTSLGVAPEYAVYSYSRCLQDVINLKSRIFRFGMAGVWGERILLPACWIETPYEYNEPAIEMALHAAHFQVRFNDYLRKTGFMLGAGQIKDGNTAVSAWRIGWRSFDDVPDLRDALGGATGIQDRLSRGTDADGRFAVKITTDRIQHMVWQKPTAQGPRSLYAFANVGNKQVPVKLHCVRGLETRSSWRRTIHKFVGRPPREEVSPVEPLPSNKVETVEIPPRCIVAVEIFA